MAVIAGFLLNVLRRYFQNLGKDLTDYLSKFNKANSVMLFWLPELR
jgi:hypothetical protein